MIKDKDVLVEPPFENRFDAFIGEGFDHQSSFTGGFKALGGVAFAKPHDTQTRSKALLRMRSALQDPDDKFFGVGTVFSGPSDDSRRGPIEISLMGFWHMLP